MKNETEYFELDDGFFNIPINDVVYGVRVNKNIIPLPCVYKKGAIRTKVLPNIRRNFKYLGLGRPRLEIVELHDIKLNYFLEMFGDENDTS